MREYRDVIAVILFIIVIAIMASCNSNTKPTKPEQVVIPVKYIFDKVEYEGHLYIMAKTANELGTGRSLAMTHDPKCPCKNTKK